MTQILLASENELLSKLYTTNLEVYLASKVTVVSSSDHALEKLKLNPQYDLILLLDINSQSSQLLFKSIIEVLKQDDLIIPIISIGKKESLDHSDDIELPSVTFIEGSYTLQTIIRASAKILNITAKDMVMVQVPAYYPFDLNFFKYNKHAPVSLYVQVKKNYDHADFIRFANKGDVITEMIERLDGDGTQYIYVQSKERLKVVDLVSLELTNLIKNAHGLDLSDKNKVLEQGFDFFISQFFGPETSKEILELGKECTKLVDDIVNDSPDLKSLMKLFVSNKANYIYKHSMIAAYVAGHLIRNVPWGGSTHVEKINFVMFFHDIYLVPIFHRLPHLKSEEDLLFNNELSAKEKDIVLNHAKLSAELVVTMKKCPMGVDILIKQHHGMVQGMGFAIDYKDDISPLAKIIIIAEHFVEELEAGFDGNKKASDLLIDILEKLNTKFKKSTYKKIIQHLETIKL